MKKYTRGDQQHISECRGVDQQSDKQGSGNYPELQKQKIIF